MTYSPQAEADLAAARMVDAYERYEPPFDEEIPIPGLVDTLPNALARLNAAEEAADELVSLVHYLRITGSRLVSEEAGLAADAWEGAR